MKFAFVYAFWLLLLVPVLVAVVFYEAKQRRLRFARLGDLDLLRGQTLGQNETRRRWLRLSMVLAFLFLVVSLAGPKFGDHTELLPRRGLDLVFAVDVSRSMRARDVLPDRLERAKAELTLALGRLGENRIGLIAFAGTAFVQCPLTTDVEALRSFVRALSPEAVPQGGTALAAGLEVAANLFDAENEAGTNSAGRVLVVITDGEDHEGSIEKVAARLKAAGVHTFFIGVGSGLGEPIPITSEHGKVTEYLKDRQGNTVMTRMSPEVLEQLASLTDGRFIDGTRDQALGIDDVEAQVALLEKRDLEARVRTTYVDRSAWPLGLGLLILLLGQGLSEAPRRRRPTPVLPLGLGALLLATGTVTTLGGSAANADEPSGFSRTEPHLIEGWEKMQSGDLDGAISAYRAAVVDDREQRAVVEYNVGVAQLERARQLAKVAGEQEEGTPGAAPDPAAEEVKKALTEALQEAESSFTRARDLSSSDEIRSDAALATGNAKAAGGDLKGAVGSFRDSVVDNPSNGRARANLRSALRMLAMQPPPPPQEDGEEGDDDDDEKKDEENDEKEEGDEEEKKSGDDKDDQGEQDEQKDDEQQEGDPKDGAPKDDEKEDGEDEGEDQKDNRQENEGEEKEKEKKGAEGEKKPDLTKEEARRILDALRQREKPLNPFSMRGQKPKTKRVEKNW